MKQERLIKIQKEKTILPFREVVSIYHDEIKDSKNNPVAHGFLIVPERSSNIFFEDMVYYRQKYNIPKSQLHWQEFGGARPSLEMKCAKDWLNCLTGGMGNERYRRHRVKEIHNYALGIRFCAIFMNSLNELSDDYWQWCNSGERTIKKFETLLRIGLKGGLHFLYDEGYKATVKGFYTDAGAFHRELDSVRIIERLRNEIDPYILLDDQVHMESTESDHKKVQNGGNIAAAHFLQLCDITLGATSFVCLKANHEAKRVVTRNLKSLLDKRRRGFTGFSRSRHFKTFTITKARIIDGAWYFEPLETADTKKTLGKYQLSF